MKLSYRKSNNPTKKRAFTMIELIAGLLAVAILGTATAVVAQAVIERSRDQVAVSRLTSLARMVQVKYTQAQGTQTWEQVLISAAEEVRFTQGSSGLSAAEGVIPQTFLDTCNFDGTGCWNILIRSIQKYQDELSIWAGGGITIASDVEAEYQECLDKISAMLDLFNTWQINEH